jgi:hypothetical protein
MSLIPVMAAFVMGGCQKTPEQPSQANDDTDMFFKWEFPNVTESPPIRWHERQPARLFATTLRPTRMHGLFPTAYLSRIRRNYQPWAERIYDEVQGGFDLKTMSPLPPEKGLGSYGLVGHEIQIEIGGWSRSGDPHPRWLAQLYKGHMKSEEHDIFVADDGWAYRHFTEPDVANLDGQPVTVKCAKVVGCAADLTIPQQLVKLPPMPGRKTPGRSTGALLAIAFHSERIGDWPEIRRKAVCFATFAVADLDVAKIAPIARLRCDDVRKAIAGTMGRI